KRHRATAARLAPGVADAIRSFRRDLNVVMARGVRRIFGVALSQYQRTLDAHGLVDFPGLLERAIALLKNLDEFAESRLRLDSRRAISVSFRSAPEILAFVNDLFSEIVGQSPTVRRDGFRYGESDRFPVADRFPTDLRPSQQPPSPPAGTEVESRLGIIAADT